MRFSITFDAAFDIQPVFTSSVLGFTAFKQHSDILKLYHLKSLILNSMIYLLNCKALLKYYCIEQGYIKVIHL